MSVRVGELEVHYSARGIASYRIELWHDDLKKHRVIKGNDAAVVQRKANLQIEDWNDKWAAAQERASKQRDRETKRAEIEARKTEAAERSEEAAAALAGIENLLEHTLAVDDAIDWETLKDRSAFPEGQPVPERAAIASRAHGFSRAR